MNRNWVIRHWEWGVVVLLCILIFVGACAIASRPHNPIFVSVTPGCKDSLNSNTDLDCSVWSQDYTYSEFAPPDENMVYDLYTEDSPYPEKGELVVSGFQTALDIFVTFIYNDTNDSAEVIFDGYNASTNYREPDIYKQGDVLFTITPTPKGYTVVWHKLQPLLGAAKPGEAILTREINTHE